jgi:hypothetical protein
LMIRYIIQLNERHRELLSVIYDLTQFWHGLLKFICFIVVFILL